MRRYIDIVADYLIESILDELEAVPPPGNVSKEIGSGGKTVNNDMSDMLPHLGVRERNKPPAYAEMFAKVMQATEHNDDFAREPAPIPRKMTRRRNNSNGVRDFQAISSKGDANALLHSDYAGRSENSKSLVPLRRRKP